jgi:glycosyltransferase involved in cell wall biosynthesis
MKIHIISPALPPKLDGIGDYTALLSTELAKSETVKILTGRGQTPKPIHGVEMMPAFTFNDPKSYWNILPIIEADNPDWVLLQYNPFMYGRWGLNLQLPEVMHRIKRVSPGTRIAVMYHEMYVPPITWQFAVMTTWQRWQLQRIGQAADVLFCSIQAWTVALQRRFPSKPVHHLPVGSNIPMSKITRVEARARLGINHAVCVLGVFGTMHPSRMLGWVREAAERVCATGRQVLVLYIGPNGDVMQQAMGKIPLIADGPLSSEEVSWRLQAMDVYLAPFHDGITTRRTSMTAALLHELPVVTTDGPLTDDILRQENGNSLLLADVTDSDAFCSHVVALIENENQREVLAAAAKVLYERVFEWKVITKSLVMAIQ